MPKPVRPPWRTTAPNVKKLAIYAENVKEIDLHNVKITGYEASACALPMSAISRRTDP